MSEGIYVQVFQWFFSWHYCTSQASKCPLFFSWSVIVLSLMLEQPVIKRCSCFNFTCEFVSRACSVHTAFHNIFRLIIRQPMTTVLPFFIKGPPRSPLLLIWYADLLAFLFSVDKSIGSGCFFPGLDPSVNLIGHAAITEMIKLQFTTITDRIQNKSRMGTGSRNLA